MHLLTAICSSAFVAFAILLCAAPAAADTADIPVGPNDSVRVRVFEWKASDAQLLEWPNFSGEFEISAAGRLFMPLLGEIKAEGYLPGQLARAIEEALQDKVGLTVRPTATVEIIRFRPIYALGQVERPGEYEFRPGMTVLNALSLAGGIVRLENTGNWSMSRDAINATGELRSIDIAMTILNARRSRLQAELNGADTIEFQTEMIESRVPDLPAIVVRQEQDIFDTRRGGLEAQTATLEDHKRLLKEEIQSLLAQREVLVRQQASLEKETENMRTLVQKGYAAEPRELSLQREVDDVKADQIEIQTLVLRARQDLAKADLQIRQLRDRLATEVAEQLQETEAEIADLTLQRDTAQELIIGAGEIDPRQLTGSINPSFLIVHMDGTEEMASENTLLAPGDVVKVGFGTQLSGSGTDAPAKFSDLLP